MPAIRALFTLVFLKRISHSKARLGYAVETTSFACKVSEQLLNLPVLQAKFLLLALALLCLGSLQITRTTPLRLITLQLRQIFFTEARTFIATLRNYPTLTAEAF